MFKIGDVEIKNKVTVAPMAGITDLPFRKILKQMGAGLLTTELVSSKGIFYGSKGNETIMATNDFEHPIALQLFGSDPIIMAEVANNVKNDYDIIDINMGCPVKKVVNNGEGAALLKNVELAKRIIDTMVRVIKNKPITCKIRIGYDKQNINAVSFAKEMENVGIAAITVHGRTKTEMYEGDVHVDVIKEVKKAVSIPIIANGNIFTIYDAENMLNDTGADAVAVARGVKGNPWLVKECIEYIENGKIIEKPTKQDIKNMMLKHIDYMFDFKNEKNPIEELRHHMAWYVHGFENATIFRKQLNVIKSKNDLINLVNEL